MRKIILNQNKFLYESAIVNIKNIENKEDTITKILSKSKCFTGIEEIRKVAEGRWILITTST